MSSQIGIWIDHSKAVIVYMSAAGTTTTTLEADAGSHNRYSGQKSAGAGGGTGEKKFERRSEQMLDRYYDDVIGRLDQPEAILLFGPGEAKLQLQARLGRSKALSARVADVHTTDKLTDAQIIAKVAEYYANRGR